MISGQKLFVVVAALVALSVAACCTTDHGANGASRNATASDNGGNQGLNNPH